MYLLKAKRKDLFKTFHVTDGYFFITMFFKILRKN